MKNATKEKTLKQQITATIQDTVWAWTPSETTRVMKVIQEHITKAPSMTESARTFVLNWIIKGKS